MPFQTKTNFRLRRTATPATFATFDRAASGSEVKCSESSNCSRGANIQIYTAEDAAWRQWLDQCPRYPDGCFQCEDAILDMILFCMAANRTIFGSDMIEVETMKSNGAEGY